MLDNEYNLLISPCLFFLIVLATFLGVPCLYKRPPCQSNTVLWTFLSLSASIDLIDLVQFVYTKMFLF